MNGSYRLREGVHLVTGAARGALLDVNSGLVYSVNRQACQVITGVEEDESFWHSLDSMELAQPADGRSPALLPEPPSTHRLKFAWFEVITDACNQRCLHCYSGSRPVHDHPTSSQTSESPGLKPRLSFEGWVRVMHDVHQAGCRSCQFIGGEPFLYRGEGGETLLDLVQAAHDSGFTSIEVFTNGLLLTGERVRFLKDLNVKVAVSLYSDDPQVHDTITKTPGSHARTVQALLLLKEHGIETRVETVLMKANQHTVESTLTFRRQSGLKGKPPAPLWPRGRGCDPSLAPDLEYQVRYGLRLRPDFRASRTKLAHYRTGHPCWLGKLAVTECGDVLPCIFSREHKLGNVLEEPGLRKVLESPTLQRAWLTTKDDILVCQDCEYRYVCFDCRALAEEGEDFYHAPYPRCTYNPYTGEWGAGVWKLSASGEPIYDTHLSAAINAVKSTLVQL